MIAWAVSIEQIAEMVVGGVLWGLWSVTEICWWQISVKIPISIVYKFSDIWWNLASFW
jgi:hypothetical protein